MNYLTADQTLLDRLAGVMGPVEIRDPSGKVLGRYSPLFEDENDKEERGAKYFDLAEAERILAEKGRESSSLADVWKRIQGREAQG